MRILSECSASVRKFLQGLDYYAAEGTRAFDEMISLVRKMGESDHDMAWQNKTIDSLRSAKFYLKGDYKVCNTSLNVICKSKGGGGGCESS